MRIGELDRLIEVYSYRAPVGSGAAPTYEFLRKVRMSKKPIRAGENFSGDLKQRYESVLVKFASYPIKGLKVTDILKDRDGEFWDIKAVSDPGFSNEIEIEAALLTSVPDIFVPPTPPSDPPWFAFTITAGQDQDWIGYMPGDFGSISAQPISGATVASVVMAKPASGEGGIEIEGDLSALEPLLTGRDVWINSAKITNATGWTFSFGVATWWVESGFPALVSGDVYTVNIG